LNKTIQDLKREADTIKKTQSEAKLEIETIGKKSGTIDARISNRIQEIDVTPTSSSKENATRSDSSQQLYCKKASMLRESWEPRVDCLYTL
jgi:predicted  nucleic acid-binding Zn-ribbon protein